MAASLPPPMDLTIAIPTYNDDPAVLARVLDAATAPAVPVVIVDMSADDRVQRVARRPGRRALPRLP